MDEGAGWVPGLDLLPEDDLKFSGVLLWDEGQDGGVEGEEHFCGELGDVSDRGSGGLGMDARRWRCGRGDGRTGQT